jgi:hypothetical protein
MPSWGGLGEICRACGHTRAWHVDFDGLTEITCECMSYDEVDYFICDCQEFIPLDNLRFLEWKYEQDNL